ncbi:glycerol-3-phosphate cytidylyltransferase [Phocicoccus schoeneichii]|uniref:Glycerol-3-phosphate cytidylyltransferase n=1 Tax=Phocicoccus schoeneichii TaxID=1812261 RepID=A0A6V7RE35_9BACL|nr:glycerol-3-phosphate cytidylyltransferase [Jeotgalicoccus schoeneichii]GGH51904.1 glycerol-3-phosphate cytidylyltransferase [Jeotgalicoccus schoeneichii]CAD2075358.1 Glycerol-3-phosphate cytidylyltransferase [Jeotgalicoccus schoeneichii]
MKIIITYGTYDLLHKGHLNLLRRAKELGDYLIVGLSTDEFNKVKNKKAYYNYSQRKQLLEALRFVDEVIPEVSDKEQKLNDIKKYNVHTFVMGDDWRGAYDYLKEFCDVKYLPRTPNISTTRIKKDLKKFK